MPKLVVTEQSPAPEPTPPPVPTSVASKNPKPTSTPKTTPLPTQTPDSTPHGKYIEGFGYVEYGGPNQCTVADSNGDINKMVGHMGDEPTPKATPKKSRSQIHYPDRGPQTYNSEQGHIDEE